MLLVHRWYCGTTVRMLGWYCCCTVFTQFLFVPITEKSGSTARAPLWPSLAPIVGGRSVYDKDSKPEEQSWTTFFASGCRTAREMREGIMRIRRLRDEATTPLPRRRSHCYCCLDPTPH